MSVMGHTKMNQLTVAAAQASEKEMRKRMIQYDDSPCSSMLACKDF